MDRQQSEFSDKQLTKRMVTTEINVLESFREIELDYPSFKVQHCVAMCEAHEVYIVFTLEILKTALTAELAVVDRQSQLYSL